MQQQSFFQMPLHISQSRVEGTDGPPPCEATAFQARSPASRRAPACTPNRNADARPALRLATAVGGRGAPLGQALLAQPWKASETDVASLHIVWYCIHEVACLGTKTPAAKRAGSISHPRESAVLAAGVITARGSVEHEGGPAEHCVQLSALRRDRLGKQFR